MTISATQKLLFVCSRNRSRSLTAEKLFEGSSLYQVRSVGTQPEARIVVTEGHLGWADIIFCMEKSHLERLRRKFPEALRERRVVCLHVPDEHGFMDSELLDELRAKLVHYVTLPEYDRTERTLTEHRSALPPSPFVTDIRSLNSSTMRSSSLALLGLLVFTAAANAKPMSRKELAEFLGPVSPKKIEWTRSVGSDFDAYSGRAMPPLSGTVNIHIGGWPHFKRGAASTKVAGRLGMFPVTWHRKVAPDGTISQEAVLTLHGFWKVDVWLEAKRQSDIDGMIALVSKLPTFTQKPKPVAR